jgi:hypothetical protein
VNYREKLVLEILLLIARWIAPEPWKAEIRSLSVTLGYRIKEVS